jgi:hypothetical protein
MARRKSFAPEFRTKRALLNQGFNFGADFPCERPQCKICFYWIADLEARTAGITAGDRWQDGAALITKLRRESMIHMLPAFAWRCASSPVRSGHRHEGGKFCEQKLFRRMFLRRRRSRGIRGAGGDGVLPLPVLPVVVRGARQCLHALEAGKREGDKGSRSDRHLPQVREAPSPILPDLWRTRDVATSGLGADRHIRGDHPGFPVPAAASCQLRRNGAAHARWASENEGLSCRNGRFRRSYRRIEGLYCNESLPVPKKRLSGGETKLWFTKPTFPVGPSDRLTFTVGSEAARPDRRHRIGSDGSQIRKRWPKNCGDDANVPNRAGPAPPAPLCDGCLFTFPLRLFATRTKDFAKKTNPASCERQTPRLVNVILRPPRNHAARAYSAALKATSAGVKMPVAEGRISIWRLWNCVRLARCPIETIVVPGSFPARIS